MPKATNVAGSRSWLVKMMKMSLWRHRILTAHEFVGSNTKKPPKQLHWNMVQLKGKELANKKIDVCFMRMLHKVFPTILQLSLCFDFLLGVLQFIVRRVCLLPMGVSFARSLLALLFFVHFIKEGEVAKCYSPRKRRIKFAVDFPLLISTRHLDKYSNVLSNRKEKKTREKYCGLYLFQPCWVLPFSYCRQNSHPN